VDQHRRVVLGRAKLYIIYCILCLLIATIYLPLFGKESVIVLLSIATATLVGITVPTIIARSHIFATEFIMVTTIILRGLTLWYLVKHYLPKDACVPFILGTIRAYLNSFLLVSDMVLFRINFFTIFIAILLYLVFASLAVDEKAFE
jgi:hypothetical protein